MAKKKVEQVKKIKVTLVKSTIACTPNQKKVVAALGLKKLNQVVEHHNSATIMGMANKISHLVEVSE